MSTWPPPHVLAALTAQLTALQDTLAAVSADLKDALSQLHALRTAHNKTDRAVAELEAVIGLAPGPDRTLSVAPTRPRAWRPSCLVDAPADLPAIPRDATSPRKEYTDASIHARTPSCSYGLAPVDPATLAWSASNPEYLAHFLHNTHLPSAPNTATESGSEPSSAASGQIPARATSAPALSSDPGESVVGNSARPTVSSSPDTSMGDTPATIQRPPKGADSSPQMGPSGNSQTSPTSPSNSQNTRHTVALDLEDPQITPDTEGDAVSVAVEADDGASVQGLTFGLFTPPSETETDLGRNLPVIPTPPSLTPEPSVGDDRGTSSLGDSVSGQAAAHKAMGNATEESAMHDSRSGPGADQKATNPGVPVITLTTEPRLMAVDRTPSSSEQPTTKSPSANVTDSSSSPITNAYEHYFRFSSPWRRPSSATSVPPSRYATPSETSYSDTRPTRDWDGDEDEVWRALVLGASGVSTPLSDSESVPTALSHPPRHRLSQLLSTSTSTRASAPKSSGVDPSMLLLPHAGGHAFDAQGSPRVSNGSLSPLTSLDDTDADDPAHARHGRDNARGSDGDRHADRDADADTPRGSKTPRARAPADSPTSRRSTSTYVSQQVGGPSASVDQLALLARREPLRIYLKLPGGMRGVKRKRDVDGGADGERARPIVMPVDEALRAGQGDEVTASTRVVPGMSAQGRGTPMSILTAPQRSTSDTVGVDAPERADVTPAPRKRTKKHNNAGNKEAHAICMTSEIPTNVPPRIEAVTPTQTASWLAPENSTSSGLVNSAREHADMAYDVPAPRKRTKKRDMGEHGRVRRKKRKQAPKPPKPPVTYHVRNGQIVTVASELEPWPATPSAARPEEAGQDVIRHQQGQANQNQAMETPLSSTSATKADDAWNMLSKDGGTWPELPSVFSHWDVQFIQCDNCDKWYHYGCVAIASGDPRLEPGALFICPTCHTQSARRKTLRNQDDSCTRPDCPEPQVTADAELFFVEKLVGRKKIEGYAYMWLAKWEGYPMSQASWIPRENVLGDGMRLFNAFVEDAVEEGADLGQDVVLLQEALAVGWEVC